MLKLLGKHVFLIGIFLIMTIHTASAQLLGLALSLGNTLAGYIFDIYLRTENLSLIHISEPTRPL